MVTHGQDDTLVTVEGGPQDLRTNYRAQTSADWTEAEGGGIHLMNDNRAEAVPYMLDRLLEEVNRPRGQTRFPYE